MIVTRPVTGWLVDSVGTSLTVREEAMTEVFGPIDYLILEYPADTSGEASAQAMAQLAERGVIRIYDLMLVRKDDDGSPHEIDPGGGTDGMPAALAAFAGARSGLLGEQDVEEAGKALEPGTSAVVLVYENRWAVPFVAAARAEGVELVASARLPANEVMNALDALESAS